MNAVQKPKGFAAFLDNVRAAHLLIVFLGFSSGGAVLKVFGQQVFGWTDKAYVDTAIAESEKRQEAKRKADIAEAVRPIIESQENLVELLMEIPDVKKAQARKAARDSLKNQLGGR